MAINTLQRRILALHLLFWCVYLSFFLYQISFRPFGPERSAGELALDAGFHMLTLMVAAYLNYFYFFPRFLAHRNVVRYLLEFALPFMAIVAITIVGKRYIVLEHREAFKFMYQARFAVFIIMNTLTVVAFVAMLKFVEVWLELDARRKELENEKLTAELRFLKAQINPHFLFNTLNNLYYLAFTQSPNTPEVVAKLAQMMRYMIYDSNHPTVSLGKEIEYMENYISLEQLRLNEPVPIHLHVAESADVQSIQVAPLILITFLENAFKHGVSHHNPDAWIEGHLEVIGHTLVFTLENSLVNDAAPVYPQEQSGIGLQNVRRRLELSYPDRYQLIVSQQPDRYQVKLSIQL